MDSEIREPHPGPSLDLADRKEISSPSELEPKIDELMRQGDRLVRSGRYQQAIHVWTRILFLDRGSYPARDAIEKAKRMLAERQREIDMMVLDATQFHRDGDRQKAKKLLDHVLSIDPRHTEARSLWEKLDTLERRGENSLSSNAELEMEPSPRPRRRARRGAVTRARGNPELPLKMTVFLFSALCLLALGGLYLHLNWDFLVRDSAFASSPHEGQDLLNERDIPLPTLSELHYFNGARLFAKGQYREALSSLERVDPQSSVSEDTRSLVLRIEERLLRDVITTENPQSPPEKRGE
jgi:tetratricopeptide (TPR) repeat protein